jgi:hypothetical protein
VVASSSRQSHTGMSGPAGGPDLKWFMVRAMATGLLPSMMVAWI